MGSISTSQQYSYLARLEEIWFKKYTRFPPSQTQLKHPLIMLCNYYRCPGNCILSNVLMVQTWRGRDLWNFLHCVAVWDSFIACSFRHSPISPMVPLIWPPLLDIESNTLPLVLHEVLNKLMVIPAMHFIILLSPSVNSFHLFISSNPQIIIYTNKETFSSLVASLHCGLLRCSVWTYHLKEILIS